MLASLSRVRKAIGAAAVTFLGVMAAHANISDMPDPAIFAGAVQEVATSVSEMVTAAIASAAAFVTTWALRNDPPAK